MFTSLPPLLGRMRPVPKDDRGDLNLAQSRSIGRAGLNRVLLLAALLLALGLAGKPTEAAAAVSGQQEAWPISWGGEKGEFVKVVGATGSGPGQLQAPRGLAVDQAGNIWVADSGNNRLEQFASDGTYLSQFGSEGTSNGKFKGPSAIDVDRNGTLFDPLVSGTYTGAGAIAADNYTVENFDGKRNGATGPGFFQLDTRFGWRFNLGSGRTFDLSADVFNLTNRANFANPGGNQGAPTTFLVLSALRAGAAPRTLQIGARFGF